MLHRGEVDCVHNVFLGLSEVKLVGADGKWKMPEAQTEACSDAGK